jgi:transcription-repair coupling factor (superfamily II helicase)
MQLKSISEKFLPDLLQKEFGKEIFIQLENNQHISVKGSAGSSVSIFVAELFLTQKKTILYLVDDKEDALYANTEMEDLLGKIKYSIFRRLIWNLIR